MWSSSGLGDCHGHAWHGHVGWENANIGDYTLKTPVKISFHFWSMGPGVSTMKDDESFLFKCVHQKMILHKAALWFSSGFFQQKMGSHGIRALGSLESLESMRVFPKIGVFPPNHPFLLGLFHSFHHPFLGCFPYFRKHPMESIRGSWPQIFVAKIEPLPKLHRFFPRSFPFP